MMKRFSFICSILMAAAFCACSEDVVEQPTTGSIAGSVSDRTTGEPVATVNVSISPGGSSTVTGSDGTFSFRNLKAGGYTLDISKEGYKPNSAKITVNAGDPTPAHLLIERIPAIVTADRDSLDFGANASTNTLSFNIVNSSYENLKWTIEERCEWITEVKPSEGTLAYGRTEGIVVVIDREQLEPGRNEAVIVVRSSNGSSEIKVTAIGEDRYVPQLNTIEATEITSSSATLNGEIIDAGAPAYTERGFVYSLNPMPTTENMIAKLTAPVTEENKYSYNVKGLKLGESYYVRAYAVNSIGTAYSTNEVKVTPVSSSPKLTMKDVTDLSVSAKSATFNGTVTDAGDPAYYERGFVYSKNSNPTVNNVKIKANGTGTGTFSAKATGLDLNQTYYVRAYTISKINNADQVTYSGEESTFTITTTAPQVSVQEASNLNVSAKTATLNGTVISVGDPACFERGFVYSTTSNPTTSNTKIKANGSGAGTFSANVSGLQLNQKYYVRTYAISKIGEKEEPVYSTGQVNFTLTTTAPSVSVQDVSNINVSAATATFNGTITNVGTPAYTERGFVYGSTRNPTISDKKLVASGSGSGTFSANASNLELNKTYYVRAYAVCTTGTVYSSTDVSFSLKTAAPSVSVQDVSNINVSAATVTFNGTITNVGTPAYTERGFVYGATRNPTTSDKKLVASGSGSGTFSINVSNLELNKTYYVRAYAVGATGTVYSSSDVSFSLKTTAPQVSIYDATNIDVSNGSATLNGRVTNVGEPSYTERGFVYGLYSNPTIDDTKVIVTGNGTETFSRNISGLSLDKTYYVRAYAININGTVYSSGQITLSTMATLPQVETYGAIEADALAQTATFQGTIINAGTPVYSERGFVYSATNSQPTIYDTKIVADGAGATGQYTATGTNLPKTCYYIRAYATNRGGTAYGISLPIVPPFVEIPGSNIAVQGRAIGSGNWTSINSMCNNSTLNGYTDWRLPTKDEIMILYNNRSELNMGYSGIYWSSDIYLDKGYYAVDFSTGKLGYVTGAYTGYGRCVRTLKK